MCDSKLSMTFKIIKNMKRLRGNANNSHITKVTMPSVSIIEWCGNIENYEAL